MCYSINNNKNTYMIKLRSLDHNIRADLPCIPTMPAWEYLRDVIVPVCNGRVRMDEEVVSTLGGLIQYVYNCTCTDQQYRFVFDYASRLELIGDVIPPGGRLHVIFLFCDRNKIMFGNFSKADARAECPVRLSDERNTDVALHCGHRFHDTCLIQLHRPTTDTMLCPLCRAEMSEADRNKIYVKLIEGVFEKRIEPRGLFAI